jgi:hypothetical protein
LGLNANITTPSRLLKTLQKITNATVGSVPHKLNLMKQEAVFTYDAIPSDEYGARNRPH